MAAPAVSINIEAGSRTAAMLSTPSTPEIATASVGVGLSMIRRNVAWLRAVAAVPKTGVSPPRSRENSKCAQLPPTGRTAAAVVTTSFAGKSPPTASLSCNRIVNSELPRLRKSMPIAVTPEVKETPQMPKEVDVELDAELAVEHTADRIGQHASAFDGSVGLGK